MKLMATGALGLLIFTGAAAHGQGAQPPQNVGAEPSTPASAQLSTRAATADMAGNPQQAVALADQAIRADPKDPWPYYNKAMALARVGEVDGALAAFVAAEQHFAPADRWGRSVAVFGRAHALAMAGRCTEAQQAFDEYTALNPDDPNAAPLAERYSADCRASTPPPNAQPGQ
jgi:Flp pilus assembly protein TadD